MSRRRLPSHLELTIEEVDADGFGEAWYGSRRVRVKAALPHEEALVRVVGRRKGAILTVTEAPPVVAHPNRQSAPCAVYPRCGGCNLQHVKYAAQLAHKNARLVAELATQGVEYARLRPPVAGPQFLYRRKARLGVRQLGESVLVGFRESFGGRIVRMSNCLALAPPFGDLPGKLAGLVAALSQPNSIPQLETTVGDTSAAMILRHLEPLTSADVRQLAEFEGRTGIRILTQSAGYDTLAPITAAAVTLHYALPEFGVDFEFGPTDFVQVNAAINAELVRAAIVGLRLTPGTRVADLFCGIGNFSLPAARRGARVVGYEAASSSIARAQANALRNGLSGATDFVVADLYTPGLELDLSGVTALLLDPPRSGAGPNLASWLHPDVHRVAYVSCNPRTFAEDARVLAAHGLRLQDVGVYDMFPHTPHIETLGLFCRDG